MTSTPATALRPVTGRLWRHRDFRRLWAAQTVSRFGSMVGELALPLTAILVLHASTLQVGMLTAVESVAFLLVGLPREGMGRPDAHLGGAHRHRRAARHRARHDPGCRHAGHADHAPALRGCPRNRRMHGLLRRWFPVVSFATGRPQRPGRRQRQTAGQRVDRPDRRPQPGWPARASADRTLRSGCGRGELRPLGALGGPHRRPVAEAAPRAGTSLLREIGAGARPAW